MDKLTIKAAITVTTGVLTTTTRIYMNPAAAAAFSAVTGAEAYPTVTVGPNNAYVEIVLAVTPDTPVGIVADTSNYVGDYSNEGAGFLH